MGYICICLIGDGKSTHYLGPGTSRYLEVQLNTTCSNVNGKQGGQWVGGVYLYPFTCSWQKCQLPIYQVLKYSGTLR